MATVSWTLDERLATLTFKEDPNPHIEITNAAACEQCQDRPCTYVCPANLYQWFEDHLVHTCEGCLECGACQYICPADVIDWQYPLGGYGVRFRWG
jgi:ferredoxin like protein